MAPPRSEVLQGTLDLIVLKTLEALGPLHGYGIAQRIQKICSSLIRARFTQHSCAWNSADGSLRNGEPRITIARRSSTR